MVLAGDPPEYNTSKKLYNICSNCFAETDNGRHVCMSDFIVPSTGQIYMITYRGGKVHDMVILEHGDKIVFEPVGGI